MSSSGEAIETIHKFFEKHKDDENKALNVCLHSAPDPDAVGSAVGFQLIARHFGFKADIYYAGDISHPQNKTIVNVLNVDLNQVPPGDPDKNGAINVCVDCTPANSCCKTAELVIDHHKTKPTGVDFVIQNANYGACSTIIWKIINELGIEITDEDTAVATALLLGIRTDTNDLISETMTKDDFIAYQSLLDMSNKEHLQKVMNYPFPRYLYEKRLALHREGNNYEKDGVFVGGIGYINGDQRDAISILSEEYVRMESVNTAVIFAIVDKETLQVSIRSSLVSTDVNQMTKSLFGEFGGGKPGAGAARIPLNFYGDLDDDDEDFWRLTCMHMFKKVLREGWKRDKKD